MDDVLVRLGRGRVLPLALPDLPPRAGAHSRQRAPLSKLPLEPSSDRASTSQSLPVHAVQSGTGASEPHAYPSLRGPPTWNRLRRPHPGSASFAGRPRAPLTRAPPPPLHPQSRPHHALPHTPSRHLPSVSLLLERRPASGVQRATSVGPRFLPGLALTQLAPRAREDGFIGSRRFLVTLLSQNRISSPRRRCAWASPHPQPLRCPVPFLW